jgi:hypothetical protein
MGSEGNAGIEEAHSAFWFSGRKGKIGILKERKIMHTRELQP